MKDIQYKQLSPSVNSSLTNFVIQQKYFNSSKHLKDNEMIKKEILKNNFSKNSYKLNYMKYINVNNSDFKNCI